MVQPEDKLRSKPVLSLLFLGSLLSALFVFARCAPGLAQETATQRIIIVGGDKDYPPYEFLDKNGQPAGFNVDLSRAIGEAMGMKLEFRLLEWSQLHRALADGRVDVLQRVPYSNLWLREADLTPPHTIINHAIFARKDTPPVSSIEELGGKKVIAHKGGIVHDILAGYGYEDDLIFSKTPMDGLRMLSAGVGEYAVVAMLPGVYTINESVLKNLTIVAKSVTTQPYGFAVRRGDEETLARFNEGLAIVKETGQYKDLRRKWFGVMETQALTWDSFLKYAAAVLLPLLALLGGTVLWSRSLRKQVEQRTKSLSNALEELHKNQQQLVQADKMAALGVLVSGVAHEINNPNGLILLNLPILRKLNVETLRILDELRDAKGDFAMGGTTYSRIRDRVPRLLESMEEGAQRIRRIVNDLKDFARYDQAEDDELFAVNEVVEKAVRLTATSIREATRRFTTRYGERLPMALGHPQRIEQVVVNLLLNSCQALQDQEKAISLATAFDRQSGMLTLHVTDEGAGIAPEDLPRLTDPFFTTKRASGGTGLGLSVSAGIVKEHGGEIVFESVPGQGTEVTVLLPAAKERAA